MTSSFEPNSDSPSAPDPAPTPVQTPVPTPPSRPLVYPPPPLSRRRSVLRATKMAGIALGLVAVFAGGAAADRSGWFGPVSIASPSGGTAINASPVASGQASSASSFALIQQAWELLHQQYVGRADLNDTKLAYGAIEGLTEAVGDTGH